MTRFVTIGFHISMICVIALSLCAAPTNSTQAQENPTASQPESTKKQKPQATTSQKVERTESGKKQPDVQKKSNGKKPLASVTQSRRAELMEFITLHHPEIKPLLNSLQKKRKKQYESAIQTLDQEIKRLQSLEKRAPEKYKKSLEQWVLRSKVKLLSAQLAIKKTNAEKTAVQNRIKAIIEKQQDLRVEQLAAEIARIKKRLAKYESQLKNTVTNRKSEVERQLEDIVANSKRISAAQQQTTKAKKTKPTSPVTNDTKPVKKQPLPQTDQPKMLSNSSN